MSRTTADDFPGDTTYARTSCQVQLGFRIEPKMAFRTTASGDPTVADILTPGRLVCTNYNSGPYEVASVSEDAWRTKRSWSVICHDYSKGARKRNGTPSYLTEYVAVGGRIQALFGNNDDEMFVLPYETAYVRRAEWIASNLPRHTTFVQVFGGLINVLLAKPRCDKEVFNEGDVKSLSSWATHFEDIPQFGPLLQGVEIVGSTPEDAMRRYDGRGTLHFIDADSADHDAIAAVIDGLDGMVAIVTTKAKVAKHLYPGWRCLSKRLPTARKPAGVEHFLLLSPSCPKLSIAFKSLTTRPAATTDRATTAHL